MRTSAILSLASLLIFAVIIYEGYGYYSEMAVERACSETRAELENKSRTFLLDRANGLSSDFGMQPLGEPERGKLGERLSAVRQKVNNLESLELSTKLSEVELLYAIVGDYLGDGGKCVLFDNMVRMGQANAITIYTIDYRRAAANAPQERISELGKRELALVSESREKNGGLCVSSAGGALAGGGEDYCQALRRLNRELLKSTEESLKGTTDGNSVLYKAIITNCLSGCVEKEASCIANCWLAKKAVFE